MKIHSMDDAYYKSQIPWTIKKLKISGSIKIIISCLLGNISVIQWFNNCVWFFI